MNGGKNFNKIIANCVKNIDIDNKNKQYVNNYEKTYLNSLVTKLKGFSLSDKEKKSIDCILYNQKNNDGMFSATIAYHFIKNEAHTLPLLLRVGEGGVQLNRVIKKLFNKNVLILDLEYDTAAYKRMSDTCKTVFTIDDHKQPNTSMLENVKVFSGVDTHGTCAFTWSIFYPEKKIPKIVQIIDINDSKKKSTEIVSYSNFIATAMGFRYGQNPRITRAKWSSGIPLDSVWEIIENDNNQLWIIIGAYMNEVQENIKEQIARNAVIKDFQGYKVGVLNFSDPVLTKRIGRQICSNMIGKIDFALLWAFEYNKNVYRVQIIDDHNQTKVNLGDIARKMANTEWGGGGHFHVGNFYRSGNIDDIFTKKILNKKKLKRN